MSRAHNFSAGPAAMPLSVIKEIQAVMPEIGNMQAGLMEISHRSKTFDDIVESAKARLRRLMNIPEEYEVLFLQGGASLQFYMAPLNLLFGAQNKADYLITGTWSRKALKEANRIGNVQGIWEDTENKSVPKDEEWTIREDAQYLHYTTNNTVSGTQFHHTPETKIPLVADISSDICSRYMDVSKHAVMFAGAQKNLGPSGVTAVILSPWAIERSRIKAKMGDLPSMLDYGLMVDKGSLFNTPNTLGIYALERVLAWLENLGGIDEIQKINAKKADLLYAEIDRSDFWISHAKKNARSQMNVTWRIKNHDLESVFVKEAAENGLHSLKGHRSVGGLRASIYNATGINAIQDLVAFMKNFEQHHG